MGNEDRALEVRTAAELPRLNIESLRGRVQLIAEVMDKVMKDGEHYGVIPGTKKPSLLKSGAEKLCITFMLDPEYDEVNVREDPDLISYRIKCTLYHQGTQIRIGSGLGSCNSREEKYRWTYKEDPVDPQRIVPQEYWKAKKDGDSKEMKRILGEGMRAAKIDGLWLVCHAEKKENDNPWNYQNTIYKMACKRALVAATLNATGASDIFTQDLEDMAENGLLKEPMQRAEAKVVPSEDRTKWSNEEVEAFHAGKNGNPLPDAKLKAFFDLGVAETKPSEAKAPVDDSAMTEPEKEYARLLQLAEANLSPSLFKTVQSALANKPGVKESLLNKLDFLREMAKEKGWKV